MYASKTVTRTRRLTVTAMLSAVAFLLMFLEFSLPMLIPSFVKLDVSDLPALLGSFALGPVYGVVIEVLKNLQQINNNMNQGAVKANAKGFVDTAAYWENVNWLQETVSQLIMKINTRGN